MKLFYMIFKHKFFVLYYGFKYTGAPLFRLIIHDWSKFTPHEFSGYYKKFVENKDIKEFSTTWLHHLRWNKHHWEHWCYIKDGKIEAVEMPEKYVREMMADWLSASRTYNGKFPHIKSWEWLNKNIGNLYLHEKTVRLLDDLFCPFLMKQYNEYDSEYFSRLYKVKKNV